MTATTATQTPPASLHAPVIGWFEQHARDLPWRRPEAGAWGVMVSEFMLQQTPVNRVLPVYEQWMARWPRPRTSLPTHPEKPSAPGAGSATPGARSGSTGRHRQ